MRMGQGVRTGLGHGGITCILQTQFSSLILYQYLLRQYHIKKAGSLFFFFFFFFSFLFSLCFVLQHRFVRLRPNSQRAHDVKMTSY